MPRYDYLCEANGQTVEVNHKMSEQVTTWGELCAIAEIDAGSTPPESPVTKLITGGSPLLKSNGGGMPPCGPGGGCGPGGCPYV